MLRILFSRATTASLGPDRRPAFRAAIFAGTKVVAAHSACSLPFAAPSDDMNTAAKSRDRRKHAHDPQTQMTEPRVACITREEGIVFHSKSGPRATADG